MDWLYGFLADPWVTLACIGVASIFLLLLVVKRASLKQASTAGGKLLHHVSAKAASRFRRFSLLSGGVYDERWTAIQCQPTLLAHWLQLTCPKEWHSWLAKRARRQMSEFIAARATKEKVAWKVDVADLARGSAFPEVTGMKIHFESEDSKVMVITANLRSSILDKSPPLGLLLNCTGQYQGQVCDLIASVNVLKLDMKVCVRVLPDEDSSSSGGGGGGGSGSAIPLYSYDLTTVSCSTVQLMPELLSGKPLDKEEEVKLKDFISSSFKALLQECNMKLEPPPPDFMRYSNGGGSLPNLGEAAPATMTGHHSASRTSLMQPIGGGMSIDLLPKQLVVEVVEGHRLCRKGKDYSDAFCVVDVDGPNQKPQHTTVVKKSFSPEWNEALVFDLTEECTCLTVNVYHHDVIRKNEFLGRGQLSLSHVTDEKSLTRTLFLDGRSTDSDPDAVLGSVTIRVQRKSIPVLSRIKHFKTLPQVSSKGLKDLRNLMHVHSLDSSHPASSMSSLLQSGPGSPVEEEARNELTMLSLSADKRGPTRTDSPAITIEGPSDASDEEAITEIQGYQQLRKKSDKGIPASDSIDQVDFAAQSSNDSALNGSLNATGGHLHGADIYPADSLPDPDRLSSVSGVSGGDNPFSTLVIETDDNPPRHYLIPATEAKMQPSVKGNKLHIYNNHVFQATRFSRQDNPRCAVCEKDVRGLGKQGYRCRDCLLVSHKKCHTSVDESCSVSSVSTMRLLYHWETPL